MLTDSDSTKIPLPFATAGIALATSYLFPAAIGPIAATVIGFLVGLALLYFAALSKVGSGRAIDIVCPACQTPIHLWEGVAYIPERKSRGTAGHGD